MKLSISLRVHRCQVLVCTVEWTVNRSREFSSICSFPCSYSFVFLTFLSPYIFLGIFFFAVSILLFDFRCSLSCLCLLCPSSVSVSVPSDLLIFNSTYISQFLQYPPMIPIVQTVASTRGLRLVVSLHVQGKVMKQPVTRQLQLFLGNADRGAIWLIVCSVWFSRLHMRSC
jgi:hypothetical protein